MGNVPKFADPPPLIGKFLNLGNFWFYLTPPFWENFDEIWNHIFSLLIIIYLALNFFGTHLNYFWGLAHREGTLFINIICPHPYQNMWGGRGLWKFHDLFFYWNLPLPPKNISYIPHKLQIKLHQINSSTS